jgi:hypothetical protein
MLLAAHHGSSTSNGETFLQAVRPELIVVSAGTGYISRPQPTLPFGRSGMFQSGSPENRVLEKKRGRIFFSCNA